MKTTDPLGRMSVSSEPTINSRHNQALRETRDVTIVDRCMQAKALNSDIFNKFKDAVLTIRSLEIADIDIFVFAFIADNIYKT